MRGSATSDDGTKITFLEYGAGPGLVVVPGNNRRAHHYEKLAILLGGSCRVTVIDRRGRGESGPQGTEYSVDREAADVVTVMTSRDAKWLFGHSYGGLIALHAALLRPPAALAVFDPGVSIHGSFPAQWLPRFTKLVEEGRLNSAMTTFLHGSGLTPLGNAPKLVFRALAYLLLHGSDGADTKAMMPTTPRELGEVVRLDSDGSRYAAISCPTLLLGGSETPAYLKGVLPQLAGIIPDAQETIIDGLDHNAPDLNAPDTVAAHLAAFLGRHGNPPRP
ncbi:alpha/beta fold hydrolase [Actinoplanes regularis]|uniref:alpha/beta fold hydrolase n=1 Tax=Actinoplanes regularis TaxID=52697 RepID=UPI0024A21C60|nr:alpha/beta hydrolase [Actinoplanes regularis]GLW31125.1 alpha/beta hydrolase [Actinoplanes regularis]